MEHWHITRNGITYDETNDYKSIAPVYYSRKDAELAVGVLLQGEMIIGTKYAITRDFNTGTSWQLCYDNTRGAYITRKEVN